MRALAPLLPFFLLVPWGLAAQTPGDADGGGVADAIFFERLDVDVVTVDVIVTDRDGNPVVGLDRDDFALFEDGRPVPITNFLAVEGRAERAAAGEERLPVSSPGAADSPGQALEPLAAAAPLYVVVYFDNLHLSPHHRNRVARELRSFLGEVLVPGDRAMVVTFEGNLHVRQGFTGNLADLGEALLGVERLSALGVQAASERDQALADVEMTRNPSEALNRVTAYAESAFSELDRSLGGLSEIVASLAGLEGRKALLYVSDGLPMMAGADLFELLDVRFGKRGSNSLYANRYSARRRFDELVASANANRVTIYAVDAAGPRGGAPISAANRGSQVEGSAREIEFTRTANLQEPLLRLASGTGGQASLNTANVAGALDRFAADLGSYYSLGYAPAHAGDGRYYAVSVEVKRKDVTVRHRSGYRDKTPQARLAEGVLAALRHEVGTNPLRAELSLGTPRRGDDGGWLVPLTLRVPFAAVTLVPSGTEHRGELTVVQAVLDEDGDTSLPVTQELPLRVPAAEVANALTQDVIYEADLVMRRGRHEVAVGLRDALSGETAFLRRAIVVGASGR